MMFSNDVSMMVIIILILTDEEFSLLKKQDVHIFEKIFNEYGKSIYNFLIIKTQCHYDDAQDILNDTFLSAFESTHTLQSKKNIRSWLIKIAHRRYYDLIRKRFRIKKYQDLQKDCIRPQEDIHEKIHKKQKALLFRMAMDNINPTYKSIITMKYLDEKKITDIARELNRTESSVINIINRAKKALTKEMKKIAENFF
jgi:RNA polymerase sigma-70 factor (ECF subfamily)